VWLSYEGKKVPAIADELHLHQATVRLWLQRFNAEGLAGLEDRPRPGYPATYTAEQVGRSWRRL
jgi:transposase